MSNAMNDWIRSQAGVPAPVPVSDGGSGAETEHEVSDVQFNRQLFDAGIKAMPDIAAARAVAKHCGFVASGRIQMARLRHEHPYLFQRKDKQASDFSASKGLSGMIRRAAGVTI